ncbi:MAG: methionyl-tRNA synthetase [Acidobacteriota bacterium]|jgi:methionyl-tRNA synthetase|nr:methionyl-tRNA synthetase [Acidobacteriota bacterium]
MFIQRLDPEKQVDAYNTQCQVLYPWEGVVTPPFGAAWATVKPGESTKHHGHQEGETFFFVRGQGTMRIADETHEVRPGDVCFQPPFNQHILTNTSETEELLFLTVWWEDLKLWQGKEEKATARPERTLVTAAPPTPNGDLHLGHLSGPYLAGDILTRYLRLRGVEARYAFGTDDNQSYVQFKGQQLGLGAAEAADNFAADIAATLKAAEIELDLFSRPNTSPTHVPLVQAFFKRLHDEGKLVEKVAPSPYCETCELYLFEAHIRGRCPHCRSVTGGNSCEDCGRPNDCDLIDPVCTHCGGTPVERPFKRLYFPLSRYEKEIREFHLKVGMNPSLRSLCEQILDAGAPDVAVTHIADWGIPVPVAGYEEQTIYVWCEMAPRYLSYAHELNLTLGGEGADADWSRFWKSPEASVVQCFGFDNGFFYGILVPALLLAFDPGIRLPEAFIMNEFYRLDGLKFSTSRRHAIWGREMVAEVPADVVRFYLAYSCPETEGTNFTREELAATVERELVGAWQPWLSRLGARMARDFGGDVPSTGDWLEDHRRFYGRVEELLAEAASGYEPRTFSPQQAVRAALELVRSARRFGRAEENWHRVPGRGEERRTGISLELLAVKALALIVAPIMPEFAARLWRELGYTTPLADFRWEERPTWVPAGQRVSLGGTYFESVPEKRGKLAESRQPVAS